MCFSAHQLRSFRLRAHHLDRDYPASLLLPAAGACGLQNSPPGAWETALFCRLPGCALEQLHQALYSDKTLLQAWSFRGVPAVFPTGESGTFLTSLIAQPGEQPWVYTRGITAALEHLNMSFDELLPLVRSAAQILQQQTVHSKEALDRLLAQQVAAQLPPDKLARWNAPSMYGAPDRQTVGGAAVSFLLRPCSFYRQVVFGRRQAGSPTVTSFENWLGYRPSPAPHAGRDLVRKFLHCHGPATTRDLTDWLGCSPRQAARLWQTVADELEPVTVDGRTRYLLAADIPALHRADSDPQRLLLLGAHDPYLDLRDRALLLPDKARQRTVWKTVASPGAVLQGGRIIGTWKARTRADKIELTAALWEPLSSAGERQLAQRAESYAAFRRCTLHRYAVQTL